MSHAFGVPAGKKKKTHVLDHARGYLLQAVCRRKEHERDGGGKLQYGYALKKYAYWQKMQQQVKTEAPAVSKAVVPIMIAQWNEHGHNVVVSGRAGGNITMFDGSFSMIGVPHDADDSGSDDNDSDDTDSDDDVDNIGATAASVQ